jgi:hypothetical protein
VTGVGRVGGGEQVVRRRVLIGESLLDRHLDLGRDLAAQRVERRDVEEPGVEEPLLEERDGVVRLPRGDEVGIADVREVRAQRVLHASEGLHLEERRAVARPRAGKRRLDRVLDRDEVVAVDDRAGHPVPCAALGQILDRALGAPLGREGELVVLAHEHHRQAPGRREVHALVHDALSGGAVAEERDRGAACLPQHRGERGTAGVGDAGADDAVAAEDPEREVGDVHRSTEPPAVAGALAEHLRHHPVRIRARCQQVTV